QLYALLAEAATLAPTTGEIAVGRLLPLTYGLAEEVYPQLLEADLNSFPWWLPLWSPQPASTLRRPPPRGGSFSERLQRRLAYAHEVVYQSVFARLAVANW